MAAIFGFGGGTNFLLGVVLAEDGQGSFASCKCDDVHGYLMCFFFVRVLSCSFFWYPLEDARRKGLYRLYTRRNCHHVNTHDPLKAFGLVANVDDQVVLTIQAAINYLTKYMGKLGTGHTATSRIGGLLDDILCRMQDHETMTVTSLLSKPLIHTAVPDQICSLEAWHILFDFPRVLSSRFFVNLNAKEQPVLKDLQAIQTGTQDTTVTRQTKIQTRDIMKGVLVGNEAKEAKIQQI